jgi:hypothetical protein
MCALRFIHKGDDTRINTGREQTEEGTAARFASVRIYLSRDADASTAPTLIRIVTVEGWLVLVAVLVALV